MVAFPIFTLVLGTTIGILVSVWLERKIYAGYNNVLDPNTRVSWEFFKKENGNPIILTTSFMNFVVIEIHVLSRHNLCNLLSSWLAGKDSPPLKG